MYQLSYHIKSILFGNFLAFPSYIAFLGPPSPLALPPSFSVTAPSYPNIPLPIADAADVDTSEIGLPPEPYPLLVTFYYIESSF